MKKTKQKHTVNKLLGTRHKEKNVQYTKKKRLYKHRNKNKHNHKTLFRN